ncbi:MAG: hypothetical protein NTY08_06520 [Proteobacteria bacterium]|nr:hypothetical protein [Pseudomonadota bacterium]
MFRGIINSRNALGIVVFTLSVSLSAITISCSSGRSTVFSENTVSPSSAALFQAYNQNINSADFATQLNKELEQPDVSPRAELPESGQIAGRNFPDLRLRLKRMIADSVPGPKLKSNLRTFFRAEGVLGLQLTVEDFQLAEGYIGAKLDAVNSPVAEAELIAKFPPKQVIRALYTITVIRALDRHHDKSASLALGEKGINAEVSAKINLDFAATIAAISGAFNSGITCNSMVKPCRDAQKNYIKNVGKFNDNAVDIDICAPQTHDQCTWEKNGKDLEFIADICKKFQLWKCECKQENDGPAPAANSSAGCSAVQIIAAQNRPIDRTAVDAACVAIKECAGAK